MEANVKCPNCSFAEKMTIPEDACIPFFNCKGCNEFIQAKNSCCIFCDYSDKKCGISHE